MRHVAALALVGWYLMIPPTLDQEAWIIGNSASASVARSTFGWGKDCWKTPTAKTADVTAPLAEWTRVQPFETLAACEAERSKLLTSTQMTQQNAECFATDDPRLKGN